MAPATHARIRTACDRISSIAFGEDSLSECVYDPNAPARVLTAEDHRKALAVIDQIITGASLHRPVTASVKVIQQDARRLRDIIEGK